MRVLYDVIILGGGDFMRNLLYKYVFLKIFGLARFVFTTVLRCLAVFFTFPTQNDHLLNHACPTLNVPLGLKIEQFLNTWVSSYSQFQTPIIYVLLCEQF